MLPNAYYAIDSHPLLHIMLYKIQWNLWYNTKFVFTVLLHMGC